MQESTHATRRIAKRDHEDRASETLMGIKWECCHAPCDDADSPHTEACRRHHQRRLLNPATVVVLIGILLAIKAVLECST